MSPSGALIRRPWSLRVFVCVCVCVQVAGVEAIDDLHVWALTPGIPLMCAHVVLADGADPTTVLHALTQHCRSLGIEHSTIQLTTTSIPCEVC